MVMGDAAEVETSGRQRNFHLFQTGLDGCVEYLVADDHADAADQRRILLHREVELATETPLERARDIGQRRRGNRKCAVDGGVRRPALRVLQVTELGRDL